jgi:hypothetical protein
VLILASARAVLEKIGASDTWVTINKVVTMDINIPWVRLALDLFSMSEKWVFI